MDFIVASSSVDGGIGCWNLQTGAEQLRYKSCASTSHGLVCVGQQFLASSQLRDSYDSGYVNYWSWSKPQVEVKSFPAEQIKPLAANCEGAYIVGGGLSGHIYLWEVVSGRLLKKWHAHYRAVTCLVFSHDDSLLISGSEDGSIKVWSLLMVFYDYQKQRAHRMFEHNFTEHTLCVTDIAVGSGGCNAIIVSASEDRTCKVWSLSKGKLIRNVVFPSIIDAIALDPGEDVFYAGSRDGKIYVAALSADSTFSSKYGLHIISSFPNHSKAVTCLTYYTSGNFLISGSEDSLVRIWDARTRNIVRVLKHAKGPINNIIIVNKELCFSFRTILNSQASSRRHGSLLPPPLEKYTNSSDEDVEYKALIGLQNTCSNSMDSLYRSSQVFNNLIKELQQQGSAASEMEMERLKLDCRKSMQMAQQWKKMYENLHQFCVKDLLDGDEASEEMDLLPEIQHSPS